MVVGVVNVTVYVNGASLLHILEGKNGIVAENYMPVGVYLFVVIHDLFKGVFEVYVVVVITPHKNFVPPQSLCNRDHIGAHTVRKIADYVNCVIIAYDRVPVPDYGVVHIAHTQEGSVVVGKALSVVKMSVCYVKIHKKTCPFVAESHHRCFSSVMAPVF